MQYWPLAHLKPAKPPHGVGLGLAGDVGAGDATYGSSARRELSLNTPCLTTRGSKDSKKHPNFMTKERGARLKRISSTLRRNELRLDR